MMRAGLIVNLIVTAIISFPAFAQQKAAARHETYGDIERCFDAKAAAIDDRRSDPATIARGVIALCDDRIDAYARTLFPGQTQRDSEQRQLLTAEGRERNIDLIVALILQQRAVLPAFRPQP